MIQPQALLFTILAGLLGSAGYYILLERCIAPLLVQPAKASRWGLLIGSMLIGIYLAVVYLNTQGSPSRYITFLLPRQTLKISVPAQPNIPDAQIAILRFSTSLGDVSYNTIHYKGWVRKGTDLVLTNPSSNTLEWAGRTGEEAVLTFRALQPGP